MKYRSRKIKTNNNPEVSTSEKIEKRVPFQQEAMPIRLLFFTIYFIQLIIDYQFNRRRVKIRKTPVVRKRKFLSEESGINSSRKRKFRNSLGDLLKHFGQRDILFI